MYGNQLNYMQTCWTVGYVIGEIPSNLLLTRVKPRYWIPTAEVRAFPRPYTVSRGHGNRLTIPSYSGQF